MSLQESKKKLENDVRSLIRKMITKPNRDQRSAIVEALRKNAKVQSKKPTGPVHLRKTASGTNAQGG